MFDAIFTKAWRLDWWQLREWTDLASDIVTGAALALIALTLLTRRLHGFNTPVVINRAELGNVFGWLALVQLTDVAARASEWAGLAATGLRITMMVVVASTAIVVWRRCHDLTKGARGAARG